MRLSEYEQMNLLKEFPNVELSYDQIIHKTVQLPKLQQQQQQQAIAVAVLAIPDGKKYFAWFTTFKLQNVCVLLELAGENKQIIDISLVNVSFHNELAYGTIFYGTAFMHNNTRYFSTENVLMYKGKDVSKYSYTNKLPIFKQIYSREIRQVSYNQNLIVFGLPQICADYSTLLTKLPPYKIKYIQFIYNGNTVNMVYANDPTANESSVNVSTVLAPQLVPQLVPQLMVPIATQLLVPIATQLVPQQKQEQQNQPILPNNSNNQVKYGNNIVYQTSRINTKREIVFKIKPDLQNDIYNLYYDDRGGDVLYEVAYIPDYKTSVAMNKLFRNIKENENLDALEESDDDEEFENDRIDKFVYLDRSYNMVCNYNYKFKKWMPIRLALSGQRTITKNDLLRSEKNRGYI